MFCPSQPIVLFNEGESANPLWKEELGGFTLSILISGNSLMGEGGQRVRGEGRGQNEEGGRGEQQEGRSVF